MSARAREVDVGRQSRVDGRAVAAALAGELVDELGPVLKRVLLFGSWARGDARRDSDIDLLVVLDDGADPRAALGRAEAIADRREELGDAGVSVLVASEQTFVGSAEPLYAAARAEGVSLRSAPGALDYRSSEELRIPRRDRLPLARQRLAGARRDLEAGDSAGAVDRAYYAGRLAAEELVLRTGRARPKTHRGLVEAFGSLVRSEDPLAGRHLRQLRRRREQVTYGEASLGPVEPTREEAERRISQAAYVIEAAERLAAAPRSGGGR